MRPAPSPDELKGLIVAFEDVCGSIPTRFLHESFKRSMRLKDKDGRPIFWDGRALLMAYDEICATFEGVSEALSGQKMLPENAEGACEKCYGSGWETTPQGARRCHHV